MIERDRVYWLDPITFEVIRNALTAVTDEMALALRRNAYSTNVKTRGDFSCAFFDRDLRVAAQAFTQPVHLGSMVQLVPRAVRAFGPERLTPGDMLITNDPYTGGVHLNDITVIAPVFAGDECFGYVANLAHHVDVGGGAPASIGAFREVFQEGVIIPAVKVVAGGRIVDDVFRLILAQIRSKRETAGDLRAQVAANVTGQRRLQELLNRFGSGLVAGYFDALLDYTRRRSQLEIPTTLVPLSPGTTSALGLLVTDLKHDDATTMIRRVDQLDPARVDAAFQGMAARKGTRPVYFGEARGFVDTPIFDRYRLPPAGRISGPAIVEELDSTTVIHPGYEARVDDFGNLFLERGS